ncbi:MAG TPA: hypothetical protein VIW78_08320 [Burkholderiales bacterium]
MPASPSFDAAWRDLDRKSSTLWMLLFGCIPGIFLLAYLLNDLLLQDVPFLIVGPVWMIAIAWAGIRMARFACPRCNKPFFENWYFFKPLRQNCAHCQLPRWAKQTPPAENGALP